jgi:hypothetical protein
MAPDPTSTRRRMKMKMDDELRIYRVKANIRGEEKYLGEDGAFYPNGDKDIIYFTKYQLPVLLFV